MPANTCKLKALVQASPMVENDDLQLTPPVGTKNEDELVSMKVRKQNILQNMCMEFKNIFQKYVTLSGKHRMSINGYCNWFFLQKMKIL